MKAKLSGFAILWGVVICITLFGMVLTYRLFVGSPLPDKIVMASGSPTGAYYWYAKRYAELIKEKAGIDVEVRQTAGTAENLALLQSDSSGVSLALIQSGVASADITGVQALASVNHEPLWVFFRRDQPLRYLSDMHRKKISIGKSGGGTRPVVLKLLQDNGITADQAEFIDDGGASAAQALIAQTIDVAFFVAAIESAYIKTLIDHPDIVFMDFQRYRSYERRYDFLSGISLPQGLLSLQHNRPAKEVNLLAMSTLLAARNDLHPGLVPLLVEVAKEIHKTGSLLAKPGTFPVSDANGLPENADAEKFLKKGPSFLYSILSFQAASAIDRLKVMIIPLLTLLLPLFKLTPPLYRWRMRAKIYRWYELVRIQDLKINHGASLKLLTEVHAELDELERDLKDVKVPLSFMEELYQLQTHIGFVQERVCSKIKEKQESA